MVPITIAALLLANGCGSDASGPTGASDRPAIAFGALGVDNSPTGPDLYLVQADGTGQRKLAALPGTERDPEWSPDGRKLLFSRSGDAPPWIMNADGTDARPLITDVATNARWSPDGASIVYQHQTAAGAQELVVMRADGTGARSITQGILDDAVGAPSWSRDGRIAFKRAGSSQIWTIRADGTGLAPLVAGYWPRWSPDGSRIAYQQTITDPSGGARDPILIANADGSNPHPVTTPGASEIDEAATWSPDGQWILYTHHPYGAGTASCSLRKVPVGGGPSVALTPDVPGNSCSGASWR